MKLNPAQRIVATTFDRPLAVMAGAGSGKTATLKERIAIAFDEGVVEKIDQVLAITFTEKAALELKSRIKSVLRTRGGDVAKQALLVDGAWISTIHGMCSRILRENAFALNIDPAFAVMPEDARNNLIDSCIEAVLTSRNDLSLQAALLFEEYNRSTLKDMMVALIEKASSNPRGFDAIRGPEPQKGTDSVRALAALVYGHATKSRREAAIRAAYAGARANGSEADAETAAKRAAAAFDSAENAKDPDRKLATAAQIADFVEAYGFPNEPDQEPWQCPWATTDAEEAKLVALQNIRLFSAHRLWTALAEVSAAAYDLFQAAKQEAGALDNNDLLVEAARALENPLVRDQYTDKFKLVMIDEFQDTDQTQLDIIKTFAGKGMERLCVVGDPQQSIYRFRGADLSVCQAHVAPLSELDESIAADENKHVVYLDANYRSHKAILDFTDTVFGTQPEPDRTDDAESAGTDAACEPVAQPDPGDVPPDYYQALQHGRNEDLVREKNPDGCYDEALEGPRIIVNEIQHKHGSSTVARRFGAQQIARHFKELHDHGKKRSYGDMVILLGAMTHADDYARELAALHIPCAITGGSVFKSKLEPNLIVDLVRALANPYDSEALLSVLSSDLFALTKNDLLMLDFLRGPYEETVLENGSVVRARGNVTRAWVDLLGKHVPQLSASKSAEPAPGKGDGSAREPGSSDAPEPDGAPETTEARPASARLEQAAKVLADAHRAAGRVPVSALVRDVLLQSGWVARQQKADEAPLQPIETAETTAEDDDGTSHAKSVNGLMRLANALKAVRMIEALEQEGCTGLRNIAESLAVRLEEAKEAPGVLSSDSSAFVRIMTIHASKGLQFPVVAVAEISSPPRERAEGRLYMQSVRGITYAALDLQRSLTDGAPIKTCLSSDSKQAGYERALQSVGRTCGTDDTFFKIVNAANEQGNLANFLYGVRLFGEEQEAQEMERKLYVAFTRAEEALIVNLFNEISKSSEEFKGRLADYREREKARDPEKYAKPRRNRKKSQEEQDAIEERIAEVDALMKYEADHVSFVGLAGKLTGIAQVIHNRKDDIERIEGGGSYRCVTPPQLEKWAVTGTLPPAYGDPNSPDAHDCALVDWDEPEDLEANEPGIDINMEPLLVPAQPLALHPARYRFAANWAEGIISASGIKEQKADAKAAAEASGQADAQPDAQENGQHIAETALEPTRPHDSEDPDETPAKATEKGTAFHSVGQYAAEAWKGTGALECPPGERIDAIAHMHGLNTLQREDLHTEAQRWFSSSIAKEMAARTHLVAEAPFFVPLASAKEGRELMVNGFIDLLAYDEEATGTAHVVDYKTGVYLVADEDRRASYGVQAKCYAYALLLQGFANVELDFVFVDQPDATGQPSVTHFPAEDEAPYTLDALKEELSELV